MADPERINEDERNEEENALFEENNFDEDFLETPPHLLALATASQRGRVDDLSLALGTLIYIISGFSIFH